MNEVIGLGIDDRTGGIGAREVCARARRIRAPDHVADAHQLLRAEYPAGRDPMRTEKGSWHPAGRPLFAGGGTNRSLGAGAKPDSMVGLLNGSWTPARSGPKKPAPCGIDPPRRLGQSPEAMSRIEARCAILQARFITRCIFDPEVVLPGRSRGFAEPRRLAGGELALDTTRARVGIVVILVHRQDASVASMTGFASPASRSS
mgnify:CR=1 FL=1